MTPYMRSITPEDPEYYAELLVKTSREAKRRQSGQIYPDISRVHGVDDRALAQRLQTLLNSVAGIALDEQEHGSAAATMASLKDNGGILDTTLYIVFNRQRDQKAVDSCRRHLQSVFTMLREVPYKPLVDGSPKDIAEEFEDDLIKICKAVHDHSFDIFKHRVLKREKKLKEIREHVELDKTHFSPEQRSTLLTFLEHADAIIRFAYRTQTVDEISTDDIQILLIIYWFWTKNNILPRDPIDENKLTLLDNADQWLAEEHKIGFRLRRWAVKIMSFVTSADRLFALTQSRHLRKLLDGNFFIEFLDSPATTPYHCDLSRQTVQLALNAALAGTDHLSANGDEARESFITWLVKELRVTEVTRENPTVHAELALVMAMDKGEIVDVLPYIGVSKLSCIMCSRYIRVFNEVTGRNIATKDSHGKACFGWFWPSLPHRDGELRPSFLRSIRQQLREDFEQYEKDQCRKSDSSGSGFPEYAKRVSVDEVNRLIAKWQ